MALLLALAASTLPLAASRLPLAPAGCRSPLLMNGKTFADFPHLDRAADVMLDDLIWWARTLRAGRLAP